MTCSPSSDAPLEVCFQLAPSSFVVDADETTAPRLWNEAADESLILHRAPGCVCCRRMALRILIADDNRDAVDSAALVLELAGHRVYRAYDGPEAIFVATEEQPDVSILDITMPRLSGHEVCRLIRETPWGRDTVIAAVTGWSHDNARVQAKANADRVARQNPTGTSARIGYAGSYR
jgi:CheY-like chemotaxis protein